MVRDSFQNFRDTVYAESLFFNFETGNGAHLQQKILLQELVLHRFFIFIKPSLLFEKMSGFTRLILLHIVQKKEKSGPLPQSGITGRSAPGIPK